jgi:hypothetical protein
VSMYLERDAHLLVEMPASVKAFLERKKMGTAGS